MVCCRKAPPGNSRSYRSDGMQLFGLITLRQAALPRGKYLFNGQDVFVPVVDRLAVADEVEPGRGLADVLEPFHEFHLDAGELCPAAARG